jgi:hypothetical protein
VGSLEGNQRRIKGNQTPGSNAKSSSNNMMAIHHPLKVAAPPQPVDASSVAQVRRLARSEQTGSSLYEFGLANDTSSV